MRRRVAAHKLDEHDAARVVIRTKHTKQRIKHTTIILAAAIAIIGLAGCGNKLSNNGDRQVIKKPDKVITVVEKKPTKASSEIEVARIEQIDELWGLDWLTEERIIVSKPNEQVSPAPTVLGVDGEKRYPRNLYIHDLMTGTDELLHEDKRDQGTPQLSPDKKHLYFTQLDGETSRGFIMSLATREIHQAGKESVGYSEAKWIDNDRVLFTTEQGNIARSNVVGDVDMIVRTSDFATSNVNQLGSLVYYTGKNYQLFTSDMVTGKKELLAKDAVWLVPSPNGKQFAYVRRLNQSERDELKMELVITDHNLQPIKTIATGSQIFGTCWSPDGSKIAYNVLSGGNVQGIYVADVDSGSTTQLAVDTEDRSAYSIRWSPLGNKLLTASSSFRENSLVFKNYIITLK